MKIASFPFTNVVWSDQPVSESRGESGIVQSQLVQSGDVSVRMVQFSAGYSADHWCAKGHVVLVLEGSLTTDLEDGRRLTTTAGNSFQVGDDDGRHRVHTEVAAKVFIVD